jgi:hypothetical protein
MKRLFLCLLALLLAACDSSGPAVPTVPPGPAPTHTPASQVIRLTGKGSMNSDPFTLAGGSYKVSWAVKAAGGSCTFSGDLWTVDPDALVQPIFNLKAQDGQSGTAALGVKAGRYYIRIAGCDSWKLAISPP